MNLIERINEHRYLYLTELTEPEDNVLRLLITEGRIGDAPHPKSAASHAGVVSETRAIVADERSAAYEVLFEHYMAYAVLNESYTVADDAEIFESQVFRSIRSRSSCLMCLLARLHLPITPARSSTTASCASTTSSRSQVRRLR